MTLDVVQKLLQEPFNSRSVLVLGLFLQGGKLRNGEMYRKQRVWPTNEGPRNSLAPPLSLYLSHTHTHTHAHAHARSAAVSQCEESSLSLSSLMTGQEMSMLPSSRRVLNPERKARRVTIESNLIKVCPVYLYCQRCQRKQMNFLEGQKMKKKSCH